MVHHTGCAVCKPASDDYATGLVAEQDNWTKTRKKTTTIPHVAGQFLKGAALPAGISPLTYLFVCECTLMVLIRWTATPRVPSGRSSTRTTSPRYSERIDVPGLYG